MGKISKALNKVESIHRPAHPFPSTDKRSQKIHSTTAEISKEKEESTFAPLSSPADTSIEQWDERLVYASEKFSGYAKDIRS